MTRPVTEPQKSAIAGVAERRSFSHEGLPAAIGRRTDLRLSQLLTARLCHELSGPIAAINNGVELLAEEAQDPETLPGAGFLRDAAALVGDSARRAGSRLQFYRFAYGFSGGGANAGPPPYELALSYFAAGRIVCDYAESVRTLPVDWQKFACNLLAIAADALPRGGRLILVDGPLNVEAIGEAAALSPEARAALTLSTPVAELTARTVQAYFTGLLAQALGRWIIATAEPGWVRLTAVAADP